MSVPDTQATVTEVEQLETENRRPTSDAWRYLRTSPMFWISAFVILVFVTMAAFPGLFTSVDPRYCPLQDARQAPGGAHLFGTDLQGCDVFARTVHGARSSILVGIIATLGTATLGTIIGTLSAYYGRWVDAVFSRLGEVFASIPLLLGSIIVLYSFPSNHGTPYLVVVGKVVLALIILGWPNLARLVRASALQVRNREYVVAAKGFGRSSLAIMGRHILPNAIAPTIAVATINLGAFIAAEATLSFLGIGLQPPAISWGIAISEASAIGYVRSAPHMLLFPAVFLSLTVLAFIALGNVLRDAFDPRLR